MQRRDVLKYGAAGAVVSGLSGCSGDSGSDGGGDTSGDDGSDDGGSDGGGDTVGSADSGEWADLSGESMLLLSQESGSVGQEITNNVVSNFEEATGADVDVEFLDFDGADNRIVELLQAGDPPEVLAGTSQDEVAEFGSDVVAEVNSVIDFYEETYGEVPESQRQILDGDDYIVPQWVNSNQAWYRGDIVGDDVPAWDSWSWDDWLTVARETDGEQGLSGVLDPAGESICTELDLLSWAYTNDARSVERRDGEIVSVIADGDNRDRWIETIEFVQELHQYSPEAADAGCTAGVDAIPNEVAVNSPYYGARPKIQSIERGRDFAGDVRGILQPHQESPTTYGGTEGWLTFQGANTEVAREFMKYSLQPEFLTDLLFIAPLHNMPPGQVAEHPEYQSRLESDIGDAWTQTDIDATLDRANYIQTPGSETEEPNTVAPVLTAQRLFSEMKFEAVINGGDAAEIVDQYHTQAQSLLEDRQG